MHNRTPAGFLCLCLPRRECRRAGWRRTVTAPPAPCPAVAGAGCWRASRPPVLWPSLGAGSGWGCRRCSRLCVLERAWLGAEHAQPRWTVCDTEATGAWTCPALRVVARSGPCRGARCPAEVLAGPGVPGPRPEGMEAYRSRVACLQERDDSSVLHPGTSHHAWLRAPGPDVGGCGCQPVPASFLRGRWVPSGKHHWVS